jgi:hypothetical protein
MRLAVIIVGLASIGVALVHLDRVTKSSLYEANRLRLLETPPIRRDLWDQQVRVSYLTAPDQVQNRSGQMALGFVDKLQLQPPQKGSLRVAVSTTARPPARR